MMWKQTVRRIALTLVVLLMMPAIVHAAQSSSTNYQVNEVFFGSGGELNSCSTSYCSKQSAGEVVVGNTASANYQAQGGFNTDREPYIEFTVTNPNTSLGVLSSTTTATANATFSVKTYLANGYTVVNASNPPTYSTHPMNTPSVPTASTVGTEQFAINLVANTSPTTFGANPVQVPSNTFSFGQVSADYSNANLYKYTNGDTVAFSTKSTSFTNYTISYIYNISKGTPGGYYQLNHILVATSTY